MKRLLSDASREKRERNYPRFAGDAAETADFDLPKIVHCIRR